MKKEGSSHLNVYLVSLNDAVERRRHLVGNGVPGRWVEGFTPAFDARANDFDYDEERFTIRYGRYPSRGEIGCAISHRLIYKTIVDGNSDIALVLEDDIFPIGSDWLSTLSDCYDFFCRRAVNKESFIVQIGQPESEFNSYNSLQVFADEFNESLKFYRFIDRGIPCWRAHAYLISKDAARSILLNEPRVSLLADDWLIRLRRKILSNVYILTPSVVTTCPEMPSQIGADRFSNNSEFRRKWFAYSLPILSQYLFEKLYDLFVKLKEKV